MPVVNWAYTMEYVRRNVAGDGYINLSESEVKAKAAASPMAMLCGLPPLFKMVAEILGADPGAEAYHAVSPISYVDRITCPALVVCATGDMLVPIEQMTRTHYSPFDRKRFPEGYIRDFDALVSGHTTRVVFEEALPETAVSIICVPLPEGSTEATLAQLLGTEPKPEPLPEGIDLPWSKDHQWSLCYLDEGGPVPHAAHMSCWWVYSASSFVAAHQRHALAADLLSPAKLNGLMQRYTGTLRGTPTLADGRPIHRLNYPALERLDVVTGLLDYAGMGPAHRARLRKLYAALPADMKPWKKTALMSQLRATRLQLLSLLGLKEQRG